MPTVDPGSSAPPTANQRAGTQGNNPPNSLSIGIDPIDPATGLPIGTRADTHTIPVGTFGSRQKAQPGSIVIAEDTAAVLMILDESDTIDPNAATGNIIAYSNRFYLTAMHEERKERLQILETFGEPTVSFFDEQTRIYNFAGSLLESGTADTSTITRYLWGSAFHELYEKYARGSKLTENNYIAVLSLENYLLFGWLANLSMQRDAIKTAKQFSFSMVIRDQVLIKSDLEALYTMQAQFLADPSQLAVVENYTRALADYSANLASVNEDILAISALERRGALRERYSSLLAERSLILTNIHQTQAELASFTNRSRSVLDTLETKKPSSSEWPTT